MRVKEARTKLEELAQVENNLRLLGQYFLNVSESTLEEIADTHGMNCSVLHLMQDTIALCTNEIRRVEEIIDNTEIGEI